MSNVKFATVWSLIAREFRKESAYLLPLRIFIGIGWIRAGLEKFIDPGWPQGLALVEFFDKQMSEGLVVFPFYQRLIEHGFIPHALGLSWLIMVGQILVGIALMSGALTNLALLCGLFMNINFIFAGAVTPSAFYIVIQVALLIANIGYVLGVDKWLSRKIPIGLLVAQPFFTRKYWRFERICYILTSIGSIAAAFAALPFIKDYSPHSVDDPAMILLVLSMVIGLSAWITFFRFPQGRRVKSKVT